MNLNPSSLGVLFLVQSSTIFHPSPTHSKPIIYSHHPPCTDLHTNSHFSLSLIRQSMCVRMDSVASCTGVLITTTSEAFVMDSSTPWWRPGNRRSLGARTPEQTRPGTFRVQPLPPPPLRGQFGSLSQWNLLYDATVHFLYCMRELVQRRSLKKTVALEALYFRFLKPMKRYM